jgi:serine O-acetyltransferase
VLDDLRADLNRYPGRSTRERLRRAALEPGFWAVGSFRLLQAARELPRPLRVPFQVLHLGVKLLTGIELQPGARIGPGLWIGHFGGIVVSTHAVIGARCNLSQGVTLGIARGDDGRFGAPSLGDRVYVGPGAKVVGPVRVGDDVAIGANAVVVKDVPAGVTVGGVPAKVISERGSRDLIDIGQEELPVAAIPLVGELPTTPPNVVVVPQEPTAPPPRREELRA